MDEQEITLPRAAVAMLLAAGYAVYEAGQAVAQQRGREAMRHQWNLGQAITAAEHALMAAVSPASGSGESVAQQSTGT